MEVQRRDLAFGFPESFGELLRQVQERIDLRFGPGPILGERIDSNLFG